MGSNRKFGIELETSRCGDYSNWVVGTSWGVKEDSSISGMEFVSPPLRGNDGYDSVMEVCDNMLGTDYQVDDGCGYHLHCDLSDSTAEQRKSIALAYHYTCAVWHSFIDTARHDTRYSRLHAKSKHCGGWHGSTEGGKYYDDKDILDGNGHPDISERYIWINWNSFSVHNTVEIRAHHGTIDGREVINWAKAHIKFVDYVSKMTPGQVVRAFRGRTHDQIMLELRFIWNDSDISDYYNSKAVEVCFE